MGAQVLTSRAIQGMFYHKLAQNVGASWVDGVSMLFQSDQESETYNWLGQAPTLREWIGGRLAKGVRAEGITIFNKTFEATLEIPSTWVKYDKTGQIMVRISEMARRANSHWASLLSTLIINGESTVCYDGQNFFDTDHFEGDSGEQSNDITYDSTSTTAPTTDEMKKAIMAGVEKILGFVDDQNEPMNEDATDFVVMIPLSFMQPTMEALGAQIINSTSNILMASGNLAGFTVKFATNTRISKDWTTKFAIFRTDGDVSAFIRQEQEGLQMKAIAEGSELEFEKRVHHYGIELMRNVGYGYWQKACLVTLV